MAREVDVTVKIDYPYGAQQVTLSVASATMSLAALNKGWSTSTCVVAWNGQQTRVPQAPAAQHEAAP